MLTRFQFLSSAAVALFASADAMQSPAINESGFVRIGGIEQWIAIQGDDVSNPVILYLHGGPAEAQSPFLSQFKPWERYFTVVNWDQRGSGKTFARNGTSTPGMTAERLELDTVEVANYALQRLRKKKLVLVGQSWGSILGVLTVLRNPDPFAAFVGTGQAVQWDLSLQERERYARSRMLAAGDTAGVKKLDDAQSLPPTDFKRLSASFKYRWDPSDFTYLNREGSFTGPDPDKATGDARAWVDGQNFSDPKLWATSTSFDARKFTNFKIPVFVIQGRNDHIVSNSAARTWVDSLHAPAKGFTTIDGGHFACVTNPQAFIDALRKYVGAA